MHLSQRDWTSDQPNTPTKAVAFPTNGLYDPRHEHDELGHTLCCWHHGDAKALRLLDQASKDPEWDATVGTPCSVAQ